MLRNVPSATRSSKNESSWTNAKAVMGTDADLAVCNESSSDDFSERVLAKQSPRLILL